jgi:hypothetical protein
VSCSVARHRDGTSRGVHRGTGSGIRLLRAAEDKAKEIGSPGLIVSAPFAGRLFDVLPRCGYTEVSRVFFKKVG